VAGRDEPSVLDEGVVDATPEQLSRQLAFVKRWFDPIGIHELAAFASGDGALPPNPLMVTFDDGYRDNHDVVLPLLLKHGVRAVFFVATDYVDRRRIFWWDRVNLLVGRSGQDRLVLSYPEPLVLPLEGAVARRAAVRRLLRIIKDRPRLDLARFLEEVERATGVAVSAEEEVRLADATVMTWSHAAALLRAGMDVQSHTHTHRVLQTLNGDDLEMELRLSRRMIADVLGQPPVALSYPVGRAPLGDAPQIRQAVRDAGYQLGLTNGTGANRAKALDALDVRRLSMDATLGDSFFRAMLALPWFAG
jgi:peptidoglycan/xylan/chitin deacetylase (PgdA/CDA1 family)